MNFASIAFRIALCATPCLMVTERTALAAPAAQGSNPLEDLQKKLKDTDENVRRKAVVDLAVSKEPGAWALVLGALTDSSPLVADEAQIRLGNTADPERAKAISDKSGLGAKDTIVRLRAAEALGRVGCAIDAAPLAKTLIDADPDVRRTALHSIELLAAADRLAPACKPAIVKQLDLLLRNEKDQDVRAAAIPARHAVKELEELQLMELVRSKDMEVVADSSMRTLADINFEDLIEFYNEGIEHDGFSSLRTLIDILVARPSKHAAVSMANLVARTHNDRAAWVGVDVLRDWSGKDTAVDEKFWKGWASSLPEDWKPNEQAAATPKRYAGKVKLMGMTIVTRNVAILVDVTGWVNEKGADGTLGRAQVINEMSAMLNEFQEYSTYDIVPYAGSAAPCDKWPNEVKPVNISHSMNCLRSCKLTGRDDFLQAARAALALQGIDTLLVITDSAPAGAHHVQPDLVAEEITQRNRFHRLVIDVLLIHGDATLEEAWQSVCEPSGGRVAEAKL